MPSSRVGRGRPLAPQARLPGLLPGAGVGVARLGATRSGCSGPALRPPPRPGRSVRKPFPDWVEYRPNQIWIYDTTHFTRAGVAVTVVEDLVGASGSPTSSRPRRPRPRSRSCSPTPSARRPARAGRGPPTAWSTPPSTTRPADPAGGERQRPADDLGLDPGVHGPVRHRPALRPARHPHRPGLDRELLRPHQGRVPAPAPSRTRPCSEPSWPSSARATTASGCMPASATSPPSTSTKGEGPPSAKPARPDWSKPASGALPSTASTSSEPTQEPDDVG